MSRSWLAEESWVAAGELSRRRPRSLRRARSRSSSTRVAPAAAIAVAVAAVVAAAAVTRRRGALGIVKNRQGVSGLSNVALLQYYFEVLYICIPRDCTLSQGYTIVRLWRKKRIKHANDEDRSYSPKMPFATLGLHSSTAGKSRSVYTAEPEGKTSPSRALAVERPPASPPAQCLPLLLLPRQHARPLLPPPPPGSRAACPEQTRFPTPSTKGPAESRSPDQPEHGGRVGEGGQTFALMGYFLDARMRLRLPTVCGHHKSVWCISRRKRLGTRSRRLGSTLVVLPPPPRGAFLHCNSRERPSIHSLRGKI